MPIATVAVVGIYVASAMTSLDLVQGLAQLPLPTINAENVTMDNPRYEGFTKDGGSYVVRARTARQDFQRTELIHLNEISGEMIDGRKIKTEMTAGRGVLHTKTNRLNLLDGIEISSSDGMGAELKSATIFTKRGVILSKERSLVKLPQGEVASDQLMIWQKQRKVTFAGDVRSKLTPPPGEPTNSPDAGASAEAAKGNSLLLTGSSNEPVNISSNLLRVEDLKHTASFVGDVRAVQGDQTLGTERLDVFFENEGAEAGSASAATGAAGRVTRMSSAYPVVITRGDGERITAERLDVDVAQEIAILSGDVVMVSGTERSARSDKAEIDAHHDTALLTGNVVVTQGTNEIKGQRLLIDRKNGTSLLTSPATAQAAEGRIYAKLQRSAESKAADAASEQSKNSVAAGISAITFKTDPNAPVEVEADELEVKEAQNAAEFRGDVRANQGGFSVRTARLVAHYSGGNGLLDPAGQDKTEDGGEASGAQLTRITAHGKVLVSSSAGQSATGDWAEFDVAANTVTLGGDVILTQGKNIIRGTRLKIDMTSGNSVIETAPEAAGAGWASTTMQPEGGSASQVQLPGGMGARGGRPSAVFYPTQFKQSGKKGGESKRSKADDGGAAASSWDARTAPGN